MNCAAPDTIASATIPFLVIGYGNELRGDDALGPRVAQALDSLNLPGVQTVVTHQLLPELAPLLAQAKVVVFVDASVSLNPHIRLEPLHPATSPASVGHFGDPAQLLGLTRLLFGVSPTAWWMTIPARNLDYGWELSPSASHDLNLAVHQLRTLATLDACTKPAS